MPIYSLREYAASRKARGLPGGSHVAVSKAIAGGRLAPPAIRRKGTTWVVVDLTEADRQWAANTLPRLDGQSLGLTVQPLPSDDRGRSGVEEQPPPPPPDLPPPPSRRETLAHAEAIIENGATRRGGIPSYAASKQRKAAIDAQLAALELARQRGLMVPIEEIRRRLFPRIRAARDLAMAAESRMVDSVAALFGGASLEQRRELSELLKAELRGLCDKIREIDPDALS